MLEIAAPNLATKPTGVDLIATNSAAYIYVRGAQFDPAAIDVDAVQVALLSDGETLHSGSAADVMGGQAQALAWLINQALTVGYPVRAGQLFMTGSIGGMQPGRPGTYQAEFTGLQSLALTISG